MENVKTFFADFKGSLFPQPPYYKKLLRRPLRGSIIYFLLLVLLVNFAFYIFSAFMMESGRYLTFRSAEEALTDYPYDLQISVHNGMLVTNSKHPYFLWYTKDDKKLLLGVIDENAMPSKISEYPTDLLLTRDAIVVRHAEQPEVIPYGMLNIQIDRQGVNRFLNIVDHLKPLIYLLVAFFLLVLFPAFTFAAGLLYLLVVSCVCFLIFKLYSKRHSYLTTFKLSLHAVTVPIIVKHGLFLVGYDVGRLSPLFSLLTGIFVLCALYEAYQDK